MKKRILSIVLICALIVVVSACKKNVENVPAAEGQKQESMVSKATETQDATETEKPETQDSIKTEEPETLPPITEEFVLPEGEAVEDSEDGEWIINTEQESQENNAIPDVPAESTPQNEIPTENPEPTPENEGCGCEYARYLNLSSAEQEAYMGTFSSTMAFIEWCKTAEAEHASHVTVIVASGGELDIGNYIN